MTLYKMTSVAQQLYEMMTNDDIPQKAVDDTLDSIGVKDKLSDYAMVINQLNADETAIKAEIARLNERAKMVVRNRDKCENAVKQFMLVSNSKKINVGNFTFSIRKSTAVQIIDTAKIPDKFMVSKTTVSPSKNAIKTAILIGEVVEGAEIVNNISLQLK